VDCGCLKWMIDGTVLYHKLIASLTVVLVFGRPVWYHRDGGKKGEELTN